MPHSGNLEVAEPVCEVIAPQRAACLLVVHVRGANGQCRVRQSRIHDDLAVLLEVADAELVSRGGSRSSGLSLSEGVVDVFVAGLPTRQHKHGTDPGFVENQKKTQKKKRKEDDIAARQ